MQSGKFRVTQISSSQSQRPVHIRWNHRKTKYYCIRSEISLPRFQEWSRRGTAPRKRDTRQRAKRIESGRREDGAGRRRRQVGRPLWDYRNGKCGWTHLDSLRAHKLSLSLSLGQSVKAYTRRVATASYHLGCLFTRATYTLDVSRDVGQAGLVLDDLSIDTRRPERRRPPPLLLTLSAPNFFSDMYTRGYAPFARKGDPNECGIVWNVWDIGCLYVWNIDLCGMQPRVEYGSV